MGKKSAFHRVILPYDLKRAGVKRAPHLEQQVKAQVKVLEAEVTARKNQMQAEAALAVRDLQQMRRLGEPLVKAAKIDFSKLMEDARKRVSGPLAKVALLKDERRAFTIRPEHNPTRYPPYDYWWYSYNWWGVSPSHTFSPRLSDGRLKVKAACLEPAGGVSGSAGVAMWYFAESSGTLSITAQTRIYGACTAMAWSIPFPMGYIYNRSKLRVGAWTQGAFNSDSRDYYKQSGVSVYDFYTGFNGQVHTLTHYIPVAARNWYLLWAIHDTAQSAAGISGTATNTRMYVNSFIHQMV